MKSAIIIVTYTSAKQTQRLIRKLNNGDFDFYIHLDKKVDLESHRILFDEPDVYFVKNRVDVKWASFTSVIATVNALKQIKESGIKYDYISNISGQDYPIKSPEYFTDFLRRNEGKQFIQYESFDVWTGAQKRTEKYHLADLKIKGKYFIQGLLNSLIKKRKIPRNIKVYGGGGSTFWTLTQDCALFMVKYMEDHPEVVRYLKYIFGSDEFCYQTIIMNTVYKDSVVNNNYRYVDWSEGGYRPKVLKTEDFERLTATDCIFARKFNIDVDSNILDLVDNYNLRANSALI
jgi:hypothetical protein